MVDGIGESSVLFGLKVVTQGWIRGQEAWGASADALGWLRLLRGKVGKHDVAIVSPFFIQLIFGWSWTLPSSMPSTIPSILGHYQLICRFTCQVICWKDHGDHGSCLPLGSLTEQFDRRLMHKMLKIMIMYSISHPSWIFMNGRV